MLNTTMLDVIPADPTAPLFTFRTASSPDSPLAPPSDSIHSVPEMDIEQDGFVAFVNAGLYEPTLWHELFRQAHFSLFSETGFVATSDVFPDAGMDSETPSSGFGKATTCCGYLVRDEQTFPINQQDEGSDLSLRADLPGSEVPGNFSPNV